MIGYYGYTVWLTYLSLISASVGIFIALNGQGHPYIGIFFLLICGLCDAFDGKVARSKKDRTQKEQKFGIQIDSLSDLVAFGVLPACIGGAMFRRSEVVQKFLKNTNSVIKYTVIAVVFAVFILYILAALIRLAYFNVTEEERQETEGGCRKSYTGLPVTSAALIFPTVALLQFVIPADITLFYFLVMLFTSYAFLSSIKVRKPNTKEILIMVAVGAVEFILLIIFWKLFKR